MKFLRFLVLVVIFFGCSGCGSDSPHYSGPMIVDYQVSGVFQGDIIPFPTTYDGSFLDVVNVSTPTGSTNPPPTIYFQGYDYVFDSFGNVTILRGGNIAKSAPENIVITYKIQIN